MDVSVHSNIGKRRKSNQDYAEYFINAHQQLLAVLCDGVGGHQAGDVASEMTTRLMGEYFNQLEETLTLDTAMQWLDDTIRKVNEQVYRKSLEETQLAGMSTTIVVALVVESKVFIAHVGDSRAYNYYEGALKQVTNDHSLVNELLKSGQITSEECQHHPHRHVITQTIGGTPTVEIESSSLDKQHIGTLMLCSDGLTDMVTYERLQQLLFEESNIEQLGKRLIIEANDAGGVDNISIILMTNFPKKESEGND